MKEGKTCIGIYKGTGKNQKKLGERKQKLYILTAHYRIDSNFAIIRLGYLILCFFTYYFGGIINDGI